MDTPEYYGRVVLIESSIQTGTQTSTQKSSRTVNTTREPMSAALAALLNSI